MTKEQAELLKLGITIDDTALLIVERALEWGQHNTTLEFDINNDDDLKATSLQINTLNSSRNEALTSLNCLRSSLISETVSPRYSTTTTDLDVLNLSTRLATTSFFDARIV